MHRLEEKIGRTLLKEGRETLRNRKENSKTTCSWDKRDKSRCFRYLRSEN
jgi:hypothetical protein